MNKIFAALLFLLLVQPLSSQDFQFQIGHTHDILKVKFSPDDRQLISYSGGDGRLCLWEVKSGHLLWVTKIGVIQKANEHSNLEEFYWSVNEKVIVTKATNETYQVWDAKTGKILSVSDKPPNITLLAERQNGFTVTKDYQNFHLSTSETKESFSVKNFSRTGNVYDVSHEGNLFAEGGSWGDAAIKITEIRTGKTYFFDGHPSVIKTITYSPDGNYLAVAGSDKNIYIFDVAKHSLLKILNGHTQPVSSIAFTSDGKILLSSSEYELMKLWDWQAGKLLQDIKSEADIFGVQKVTFSLDGKYFLTTSDRAEFRLWDAQTWKLIHNFKTNEKYESSSGDMVIGYNGVPVSRAMFSRDSKRIISSHTDGTLRIWNLGQRKQINRLKLEKELSFIQHSVDEKSILAAHKGDNPQIKFFEENTGKTLFRYYDEDANYIEALSLSANGKFFATSDVSGDVLLWAINKHKPIHKLDIGFSGSDALAFSPDGKTLAVGGRNQNLFLFDTASGNKLWQLIPSYQPSELETRLTKEKEQRQAKLNEVKLLRDKQAAIDTKIYKKKVYLTFDHFGDAVDSGQLRMLESDVLNKSKVKKNAADASAIWLRLHNDSPLPIQIPTQSMYPPTCSYQFSSGNKISGLCDNREVSIWFGLENKNGKSLHYGFDFGSSTVLLPKTSVLFSVPREILINNNAIRFEFTFQNETNQNEMGDYGKSYTLRFRESGSRK